VIIIYKDLMIQACFWSSLFYSTSYPFIHLYIMRGDSVNAKMVSICQIIICISIILINNIWNKYSKVLYKYFRCFMAMESITYLILTIGVIISIFSPAIYYVADTILFALITKNIICGGNKLKSMVYKDDEREKYDNTIPIASAVATLIGSLFAFVLHIPIQFAFILSWIGLTVDNIFYWLAYNKHSNLNYNLVEEINE